MSTPNQLLLNTRRKTTTKKQLNLNPIRKDYILLTK